MTAAKFLLRRAGVGEAPILAAVGIGAWSASAFADFDRGRTDRFELETEFCRFCREYAHLITVAWRDDRALGWGAREHDDFRISDLWVTPSAQGQGVGAALLVKLENDIRKAGHRFAELETYAGNSGAIRFYRRQGYEIVWQGLKHSDSLNYALEKVRLVKSFEREPPNDTRFPAP
ncbi:GNAT family N-acetyltransferase [Devosia rhodophyticola]|uniref:GNAT family N-acetyltransferase n=1 Tax=Devosia rhodophyticola TaxID=3026423 RepID=A0ABY7YXI3_9HYPH|nr:GNAT family N-acetyltransferase [Devosia rhodophyticola]WDR05725.1 GNAT family N-acetyltransferase [Devosia rhodophyticola]